MDEKQLRLILADIDGTLVNEERYMTPLTRDVLNHLHRKGILFGIASGRPQDELERTTGEYNLDFPCDFLIGMNGGEIQDNLTGAVSVHYPLDEKRIREIIEEVSAAFPESNAVIYRGHMLVAQRYDELIQVSEERAHKKSLIVDDDSAFWSEPTGKIMFRVEDPALTEAMEAYAKEHPHDRTAAFKTQPTLLEYQDDRVNKGVALHEISKRHRIPVESIIAFGDASNDNEMLREAGLGVCLINGLPDTKASADELTEYDNEQDGMARYLISKFPALFEDFQSEYLTEI